MLGDDGLSTTQIRTRTALDKTWSSMSRPDGKATTLAPAKYRVMADDGPTMSKWDEPVGSAKKEERKPTPWWIWMALLGTVGNILVVIVVYLWTTMYS
ncbi:Hypp2533 [Branchiostoma lanceolatum]|uniref:Hypp2533 protein n=1 Tax=Branchiostoma lanceolatum TaxID=7740 RepID=A0A8J9ZUC1_BRALA|nr:Hypp2533 [Branchiostoma lanceolatum]